jgi:hypothetical protein
MTARPASSEPATCRTGSESAPSRPAPGPVPGRAARTKTAARRFWSARRHKDTKTRKQGEPRRLAGMPFFHAADAAGPSANSARRAGPAARAACPGHSACPGDSIAEGPSDGLGGPSRYPVQQGLEDGLSRVAGMGGEADSAGVRRAAVLLRVVVGIPSRPSQRAALLRAGTRGAPEERLDTASLRVCYH